MAQYFCSGNVMQESLFKHYALNVPLYTHFTSPIRRYADIIVHRLLASSLSAYLLYWSPTHGAAVAPVSSCCVCVCVCVRATSCVICWCVCIQNAGLIWACPQKKSRNRRHAVMTKRRCPRGSRSSARSSSLECLLRWAGWFPTRCQHGRHFCSVFVTSHFSPTWCMTEYFRFFSPVSIFLPCVMLKLAPNGLIKPCCQYTEVLWSVLFRNVALWTRRPWWWGSWISLSMCWFSDSECRNASTARSVWMSRNDAMTLNNHPRASVIFFFFVSVCRRSELFPPS